MKKTVAILLTLILCFALGVVATAEDPVAPVAITPDYTWYSADAIEYTIDSVEDLAGLAKLTQGDVVIDETTTLTKTDFANKTVKLTANITFADNQYWYYDDGTTTYDYVIKDFAGTFDGATGETDVDGNALTYTIKGLKFYSPNSYRPYLGLFNTITGNIENLTIDKVTADFTTINGAQHTFGTIAYKITGNATNCHIKNVIINTSGSFRHVGGMFSHVSGNATVTSCTATSVVIKSTSFWDFGGLIAVVEGNSAVTDCEINNVTLECSGSTSKVGGFIGRTNINSSVNDCSATDVTIIGNTLDYTGGFIGHAEKNTGGITGCQLSDLIFTATGTAKRSGGFVGEAAIVTISECTATNVTMNIGSETTAGHGAFGGFVGQSNSGVTAFENCHLYGLNMTVYGIPESCVGGFITATGNDTTINKCSVSGKIDAKNMSADKPVGGFLGDIGWGDGPDVIITDCTASVEIDANGSAGGFVARSEPNSGAAKVSTLTIKNSVANGNVTSLTGAAGGFVGIGNRGTFENCTANGNVTGVTAGGFWGEMTPNTSSMENKSINITGSSANGTVTGTEVASGFVGTVTASGEGGANVTNVTIANSIATPLVSGADSETEIIEFAKEIIPEGSESHLTQEGNKIGEIKTEPIPESKPAPCDHNLDENGKCSRCGIIIISYEDGKPSAKEDDETNPSTGAPVVAPAVFAVIVAAAFLRKRK